MAKMTAYFHQLVLKPAIIDGVGNYKTRCGETVAITMYTYKPQHDFDCHGKYANGIRESWHRSGRLYADIECDNDIVEKL